MLGQQIRFDLENKLDQLTTQADGFFTELECEGCIHDTKSLLSFLDEIVDFLEGTMGGKVESIQYLDDRHLAVAGFRRQQADFGMRVLLEQLMKENEMRVLR